MKNEEQHSEYGHVLTIEERKHLACRNVVGDYESCLSEVEERLKINPHFSSWHIRNYAS
ncbi:MAG: hypothetical protein WDZ88_00610 [Candidatus Paceibacterota bacterium]